MCLAQGHLYAVTPVRLEPATIRYRDKHSTTELPDTYQISKPGFALPIAIVAKCEEILNLAQKILIWRQLLAKEKSQVIFFCLES